MRGTLKTRGQFALCYENGSKAVGSHAVVFALRPPQLDSTDPSECTIGIVASRKVGGAIQRNRAKRVLRAALHEIRARIRRPAWIVLVARRALIEDECRTPQLVRELEAQLRRLDCLMEVREEEEI